MKKRIAITIDVEAQTARAEKDHINRLIWGKHQGPRFGINLMMALADAHQIQITHFLDYVECELYGEALLDVGREILLRGHDLQLHQHADFYSADFFARHSLTPEFDLVKADKKRCEAYMDYILQAHAKVTSQPALAYRGGGYRLGWPLLQTLKESGIQIDASYNPQHHRNPAGSSIRSSFCWPNGLFELPVPCLLNFRNRPIMPYNFNSPALLEGTVADCIQHHKDYLRAFFARHGDDAVATLVMHSWSFFKLDAKGFFTIRLDDAVEKYEALLSALKQDYEFVSVGQIAANMEAELTRSKPETIALTMEIHRCPICWEPVAHFKDLNGVANRHCPVCKSVERQRVFQLLYASGAFGGNSLDNKTMLHIAPGAAEKTLFKSIYSLKTVSVDIRPEVHADMTADITSLKDVPDNSYDVVFASFVFTCTKELAKAMKELHRVLKPFGMLLCHDPLQIGKMTTEHQDLESITSYYGAEAYNKYSIGSFRSFGELDYVQQFAPYFEGTVYAEKDPGTGADIHWFCGVRMYQAPEILDTTRGKKLFSLLANHFCQDITANRGHVLSLGATEDEFKVLKSFFSATTQADTLRVKQSHIKKMTHKNGLTQEADVDFYQKKILITPGTYEGIASGSCGAVYAPFALQHTEERMAASHSLYRILRPGGCAILIHELEEPAESNRAELLAELSSLCVSVGFTVRDASAIYAADAATICLLLVRDEQAIPVDIKNITAHMTESVPQKQVPGAQWTLLAERSYLKIPMSSHHQLTIDSLTQTPHTHISPKNDNLSVFFEPEYSFSWTGMGKDLLFLPSLEMAKQILFILTSRNKGNKVNPATFIKNYSEQINPYGEVSLIFLYAWVCGDYEHSITQEKEHSEYLENIIEEIIKWMDCFGFWDDKEQLTRHTQLMVWNDAAAGVRLLVFAYVLQRLLHRHDSRTALCERILRTAMDHYLLLASDTFYNPRTNHGFFQNASLLCFCYCFPQINGTRLAFKLSEKRLLTMLDERVSPEGVLKEHSTGYHNFFLTCHIELLKCIPMSSQTRISVQQSIQKMLSILHHFILPDGSLACLGDSSSSFLDPEIQEYLQAHPEPKTSPVTIFPSAGYGFLHSAPTQSCVILAGAFHSRVHKHCDELHILWSEGTDNLLVDSGMFNLLGKILPDDPRFAKGFWYSDPKRIYAESVHAHNCVEINGESYSRKIEPYGALPIIGGQASGTALYLKSNWKRPDGYTQNRILVLQPGQWLLVFDRLDPTGKAVQKARFSQWFHLSPQAQLASLGQAEQQEQRYAFAFPSSTLWCQPLVPVGSSSTHCGETEPRLQGWVAKQTDTLIPAYTVGYHVESHAAQFATLFTLNKTATGYESIVTKSGNQIVELTFSDGTTDSFRI